MKTAFVFVGAALAAAGLVTLGLNINAVRVRLYKLPALP